jgi:hypothetical protein
MSSQRSQQRRNRESVQPIAMSFALTSKFMLEASLRPAYLKKSILLRYLYQIVKFSTDFCNVHSQSF